MSWFRILLLVITNQIIWAQGYFRPDQDQQIKLDEIEIANGKLFSNHLQIRPYNKEISVQELNHYVENNQNKSDWTESANQLVRDLVEVSDPVQTDSLKSQQSNFFRKYFYTDGAHLLDITRKDFQIILDPLLEFSYGKLDTNKLFVNRRGVRISGYIDKKVYFHSDILENQMSVPPYVNDYINLYQSFPGAGLYKIYQSKFPKVSAYDFLIADAAFDFKASKHIQISLGHGQQFIGSGIRSMLLSDFAAPHFYLQINTNIWKLHYQNLFFELSSEGFNGQGDHLLDKKYMAAHYLSVNITKKWNAGIFESVVFGRRNGFELQYLNPVILYRFVEHSVGSPDNEFIGFHSNYLLANHFSVYGQLLLDEFQLKEFFSSRGWWGNKYGLQFGCKYVNAFGIDHLSLQVEYNQLRPYTYSFRDSIANYTQYHQALAHPLGANFREFIVNMNYEATNKWTISGRMILYHKGLDSIGTNYGGNILLNYDTRIADYGNSIAQGISNQVVIGKFNISYRLFYRAWLDLSLNYRNSEINQRKISDFWIQGGFRMNLDKMRFEF